MSASELAVVLGVVSWATCGDGRSRERRALRAEAPRAPGAETPRAPGAETPRARVGRRAKALLDWARARWLADLGFAAHLCQFVPEHVSPENLCIVATR